MPHRPYREFSQTTVDEELRVLLEEQMRLRTDIDRLLKQQQQLLDKQEQQTQNGGAQNGGGAEKSHGHCAIRASGRC